MADGNANCIEWLTQVWVNSLICHHLFNLSSQLETNSHHDMIFKLDTQKRVCSSNFPVWWFYIVNSVPLEENLPNLIKSRDHNLNVTELLALNGGIKTTTTYTVRSHQVAAIGGSVPRDILVIFFSTTTIHSPPPLSHTKRV